MPLKCLYYGRECRTQTILDDNYSDLPRINAPVVILCYYYRLDRYALCCFVRYLLFPVP